MTKEDKNLLIQDLSARLLYNVKCQIHDGDYVLSSITSKPYNELYFEELDFKECDGCVSIEYCKPYLFPLSSMTEEQKEELENLGWYFDNFEIHNVNECFGTYREYVAHSDCFELIDWLNKNHFDYRGLIEKGLAINCTNLNIY